jgi:hypothetical protein
MPAHLDFTIKPHDANDHFRRHARTLFSVPLTLRHLSRSGVRATRGISLDIGEGGLGAIVQGDVHVGDTLSIDLRLWEKSLTAVAVVRHTNIRSGFEFVGLTPEERLQIANVIPDA